MNKVKVIGFNQALALLKSGHHLYWNHWGTYAAFKTPEFRKLRYDHWLRLCEEHKLKRLGYENQNSEFILEEG